MKKAISIIILCVFVLIGCGPKPQWKTREGKKKLKHYNELQYNKRDWDKARKKPKRK